MSPEVHLRFTQIRGQLYAAKQDMAEAAEKAQAEKAQDD